MQEVKEMKTRKKIIAVMAAFAAVASAGVLLVSEHADAVEKESYLDESLDKAGRLFGIEISSCSLTEEQKLDILSRVANLKGQGISLEEIRTEIQGMLQDFGASGEQNIGINEMIEIMNEKFNWAKNHTSHLVSHERIKEVSV